MRLLRQAVRERPLNGQPDTARRPRTGGSTQTAQLTYIQRTCLPPAPVIPQETRALPCEITARWARECGASSAVSCARGWTLADGGREGGWAPETSCGERGGQGKCACADKESERVGAGRAGAGKDSWKINICVSTAVDARRRERA